MAEAVDALEAFRHGASWKTKTGAEKPHAHKPSMGHPQMRTPR